MDDIVYDGTGLPAKAEQQTPDEPPAPDTQAPEAQADQGAQTGGEGPAYETDATGPAPASVSDGSETSAASPAPEQPTTPTESTP